MQGGAAEHRPVQGALTAAAPITFITGGKKKRLGIKFFGTRSYIAEEILREVCRQERLCQHSSVSAAGDRTVTAALTNFSNPLTQGTYTVHILQAANP